MASTEVVDTRYSRRIVWLGVGIVVVIALYCAGWFYLAARIEREAAKGVERLNRDGVTAACDRPTARGFPFRIGLYCDHVAYADSRSGISVSAGGFRSAGQIYDPFRVVGELDSPAQVTLADGSAIGLDWSNLRASAHLARPLPELVSMEGAKLKANLNESKPLFTADAFEMHFRPNGANVDLAGSFTGLLLDPGLVDGRTVPLLGGKSDLTIDNGVALIAEKPKSVRGQSLTIRELSLTSGPSAGLTLSGNLAVGDDGLVDGTLNVVVHDPKQLAAIIGDIVPDKRDEIETGLSALSMLGNAPSLPLKIVDGKASLAFLKLGKIPPLK